MKKRLISFAAGLLCLCCLTSFAAPAASLKSADAQLTVAQAAVTKPGTVTGLKATGSGKNRVTLTWTAVSGAQGYLVYGQKSGKYAYVGMTTSGTTFTDTKALDNDYNYYWVFAYVKDASGKMIPGGCQKYVFAKGICPVVPNLKAASTTSGVKLTWSKVNTAEGYLIYGKTDSTAYGYKGMTTGLTWTDTKAPTNEFSFYWVFAYHKDASGKMVVGGTGTYVYGKKALPEYKTAKIGGLTYSYATVWTMDGEAHSGDGYYYNAWFDDAGFLMFGYEKVKASFDFDSYVASYNSFLTKEYEECKIISTETKTSGDLKIATIVATTTYQGGITFRSKLLYDTKTSLCYFFEAEVYTQSGDVPVAAFNKRLDVCFASIKKA